MRRQLNWIAILVSILIILVLSLKCFLKSMILAVMGDDSFEWNIVIWSNNQAKFIFYSFLLS